MISLSTRGRGASDDARMVMVALAYASRDGQTRRIAERIAATLGIRGFTVDEFDVMAGVPTSVDLARYDAAVVASSIRMGKHASPMLRFVRDHREALVRVPNLFLPVSLSAHGVVDPAASEERRDRAAAAVEKSNAQFMRDTGWTPRATHPVAGALLYRQYGFPVRWMMRFISAMVGATTDTSRDHEYTDWAAIERYANELAAQCLANARDAG